MLSQHCIFCDISISAKFKNEFISIIEDSHPISPGHLLIITKRHIETFFKTTQDEKIALLKGIEQAKNLIEKKLSPDGYNIGINDGKAAGQTVTHLHIHLIPRYDGDSKDPRGGIRWIFPDKAPYWKNNV